MLLAVLILLLAFGLASLTYLKLERLGRRAWIPLVCRGTAWAALGLLLVNLSCSVSGAPLRPLVLLDASLSMSSAGGKWAGARDSAARWGEVRPFGDERLTADTAARRGRSLLGPALLAASASERPVIVVTDGEIEDRREIPPDIMARAAVRVFPRERLADLAISSVNGPERVSAGDSIPLEVVVEAVGQGTRDTVTVEVRSANSRVGARRIRLADQGGRASIVVPPGRLAAGEHILRVALSGSGDNEARTDTRLHLVTVAATPGVVLLAGPPDWDSRFLYRTLREVAQLPVRGYARFEQNRWYSMVDLRSVAADRVGRAARGADLLVLKGAVSQFADGSQARAIWSWPDGANTDELNGDWYLAATDASPISGAFLGQPIDSFPPASQLTPLEAARSDWVGLRAQLGRRGSPRDAVFGRQQGATRRVTVAVDGLWRWAFRGGSSEQTYRAWVASTVSWLLAGSDSAQGLVRPAQRVVTNGRPIVFEWIGSGPPAPQVLAWSGGQADWRDTLYFDGDGRATVWLDPGEYRYRLERGATGMVAVEQYSDELLPRPVTLQAQPLSPGPSGSRRLAREWLWLFGICIVGLSGEWLARRRLGLR